MGGVAVAQEHPFEHRLRDRRIGGVPDEVGAEFAGLDGAEHHVVAHDLALGAIRFGDGVEHDVGVGGLVLVGELHVGELVAAERRLLLLDGDRVPLRQVVDVLLDDDVAAAGEVRVLVADEDGVDGELVLGIGGAVDEAEDVALVEVAERVDLVDDVDVALELAHQLAGEFEAHIRPVRADVEEEVAGRRRGDVLAALELLEGVELRGALLREETIPEVGADAGHAAEAGRLDAEADGADDAADLAEEIAHVVLGTGFDGDDEEDARLRRRLEDVLRVRAVRRVSILRCH